MPTVDALLDGLETLFPGAWAEDWDACGLQLGWRGDEVRRVLVCLDLDPEAIGEAAAAHCEAVVSHHPLFFHPPRRLDIESDPQAATIAEAIGRRITLISLHTNADKAPYGFNRRLAQNLGLGELQTLAPEPELEPGAGNADRPPGLGCIGRLPEPMPVEELLDRVKQVTGAPVLRLTGTRPATAQRIAVCGGAGGSLWKLAGRQGAEVLVTADWKYHEAREVMEWQALNGSPLLVVDPGHFASERLFVEDLREHLEWLAARRGWSLEVLISSTRLEPFEYY